MRGHAPVFQVVGKQDEKILEQVSLERLSIPEIHNLLVKRGFQPKRPATSFGARFVSGEGKKVSKSPGALRFLKTWLPARGGYIRRADGEEVKVEWKTVEQPRLDLVNKADGKVVEELQLGRLSAEVIEGVLTTLDFVPAISGVL